MAYKYYNARLGLSVSIENGLTKFGATNFGSYRNAPTITNQYGMVIPKPTSRIIQNNSVSVTDLQKLPAALYVIYYDYGVDFSKLVNSRRTLGNQNIFDYFINGVERLYLMTGVSDDPFLPVELNDLFADHYSGTTISFLFANVAETRNSFLSADRAYVLPDGDTSGQIVYHDLFIPREDNDVVNGHWNLPYTKNIGNAGFVQPLKKDQIRHEINGLPTSREALLKGYHPSLKEISSPILKSVNKGSGMKNAFSISDATYDPTRFMDYAFAPVYLQNFSFNDVQGKTNALMQQFTTNQYFGGDYYGGFAYPKSWSGTGSATASVSGAIEFQAPEFSNPHRVYEEFAELGRPQQVTEYSYEALKYTPPAESIPFTVSKSVTYTPYSMDYDNRIVSWNEVPWLDDPTGANVGNVISTRNENLRMITPPFAHSDVDGQFPIYSTNPDSGQVPEPAGHPHAVRQSLGNLITPYSATNLLAKGYVGFDNCKEHKFGHAYIPCTTSSRIGEDENGNNFTYTIIQPSYRPVPEVDTFATLYKSEYWSTIPENLSVSWNMSGGGTVTVQSLEEDYALNVSFNQNSTFSMRMSFHEKHYVSACSVCDTVGITVQQNDVSSIKLAPPWYDFENEELRSFGDQFGNMISYNYALVRKFGSIVQPGGSGFVPRLEDYIYVEKTLESINLSKTGTLSLTGLCPGTGRELRDVYTINESYSSSTPFSQRNSSDSFTTAVVSSFFNFSVGTYGFNVSNSSRQIPLRGATYSRGGTTIPIGNDTVSYPCNRSHKSSRLLVSIGDTKIIREVEFDIDYSPRLLIDTSRGILNKAVNEQSVEEWRFGVNRRIHVGQLFGVGDVRSGEATINGAAPNALDLRFLGQATIGSPKPIDSEIIGLNWYFPQTLDGTEGLNYPLWSGLTPAPLNTAPRVYENDTNGAFGCKVNSYSDKLLVIKDDVEYEIDELGSFYLERCRARFDVKAEGLNGVPNLEILDTDFNNYSASIRNLLNNPNYGDVYIENFNFFEFSFATNLNVHYSNQNQYIYTKDENIWDMFNDKTRIFIDDEETDSENAVKDIEYVGEKGYQVAYKALEGEIIDIVGTNSSFDEFSDAESNIQNNKALRVIRCLIEEVEIIQFYEPGAEYLVQQTPVSPIRGDFDFNMMAVPAPQYSVTATLATNIHNEDDATSLYLNKFALNPTGFAPFTRDSQRTSDYTPIYGYNLAENEDDIFSTRSFTKPPYSTVEYVAGIQDEQLTSSFSDTEERVTCAEYGTSTQAFNIPVTLGRKDSQAIYESRGYPRPHFNIKRMKVLSVFQPDGYLTAIHAACRKEKRANQVLKAGHLTLCTPNNLNHMIARGKPLPLIATNTFEFENNVYGVACLNTELYKVVEEGGIQVGSGNNIFRVAHSGTTISTIDGIWFDTTDNKFKKVGDFKYQKIVLRASNNTDENKEPIDLSTYKPVEVALFKDSPEIVPSLFSPELPTP